MADWETIGKAEGWETLPKPSGPNRVGAVSSGLNKFVAGTLGLPVDTATNLANLGLSTFGASGIPNFLGSATGKPPSTFMPDLITNPVGGSGTFERLLNQAGASTQNPSPEDITSRLLHTGAKIGASGMFGAPVQSGLAGLSGALAGEAFGPAYEGVGAMLPSAGLQAGRDIKTAIANPRTVQTNQRDFAEAGSRPTVGQASENTMIRGIENLVGRIPGGAGVMREFSEKQQADIGNRALTGVTGEQAGRTIEKGISGPGGFLERTRSQWKTLDNEMASKIPQTTRVHPANTLKTLDDLTKSVPNAAETSKALSTPRLEGIREALMKDTAGIGTLEFTTLRGLRSRVGEMLDDAIVNNIPNGELKRLYGSLSEDMKIAANQAGAGKEWAKQNDYYSARMDRIESALDRVIGKNRMPEEIFSATAPKNREQSNVLRQVMRSLEPGERDIVAKAVVNRLGYANPGKQDFTGEKFSTETFLTNWSKIGDKAKQQLFPDPAERSKYESIAKAASDIRDSSEVFKNPSGTAGTLASYGLASSIPVAITTGSVAPLLGAAGFMGAANMTARAATSPGLVNWLAKPPATTPQGLQQSLVMQQALLGNQRGLLAAQE